MIIEPKQAAHYSYFVVFTLLCLHYITDMIKKLEFCFLVVIILFKVEFGHFQISVLKIGTRMLETTCINP